MQKRELELRRKIREINKSQKFFVKEKNLTSEFWALETEKTKLKQELKNFKKKNPTKKEKEKLKYKKLLQKADVVFSDYIKLRDTNSLYEGECITCNKSLKYIWRDIFGKTKKNREVHNCHWIPRGYYSHRWNEDNCAMGCSYCNTYDQENHHNEFTKIMTIKHGIEWVEKELISKHKHKPTVEELEKIITRYEKKVKRLKTEKTL